MFQTGARRIGDNFKDLEEIQNRLDTAERSLIRIDAAAKAQSEAAQQSARALIAEQQSTLTKEWAHGHRWSLYALAIQ